MNLDINIMQVENGWYVSANCYRTEFGNVAAPGGMQGVPNPEYAKFAPRNAVFDSYEELHKWLGKVAREVLTE